MQQADLRRWVPNLGGLILLASLFAGAITVGLKVLDRMDTQAQQEVTRHESKDLDLSHPSLERHYVSKTNLQTVIKPLEQKIDTSIVEQRSQGQRIDQFLVCIENWYILCQTFQRRIDSLFV